MIGWSPMVVRSGIMTPAIMTGDVVLVRPFSPTDAQVGDIVAFKDPDGSGRLLVHRVRAVSRHGGQISVTTQGDANTTREHWRVTANGSIGTVAYRVPHIGFAASWNSSPPGRIALIVVPAILLAASALARIWRPRLDLEEPR
jgi:signal peptidase